MLYTFSSHHCNFNLDLIQAEDSVLFWQDGVLLATQSAIIAQITTRTTHLYALQIDVEARGLHTRLHQAVTSIDLNHFVTLTETCAPQVCAT